MVGVGGDGFGSGGRSWDTPRTALGAGRKSGRCYGSLEGTQSRA